MRITWIPVLFAVGLLAGCNQEQQQPAVAGDPGQAIYIARCALCHGADLQGKPGFFPPLTGSAIVQGPPSRFAAIILDGLHGPDGAINGVMPGWRGVLRDADIAAVMTWLRQSQGQSAVTPVEVGQIDDHIAAHNTFWTVEELQSLK